MADLLRITTPVVDKNQMQVQKTVADPNTQFQLSDITKVIKPAEDNEILKQNTGFTQQADNASVLMSLLKDPSVTVGFLKNIDMLQQFIKLLPINNQSLTAELKQLFDALLISPEALPQEMLVQENASSSFRGELFDFLRALVAQGGKAEINYGVANLLKSLTAMNTRENILNSVSNNLGFLSDSLSGSQALSSKLAHLAERFRGEDAAQNFPELKNETLLMLKEVSDSVLFSPNQQKIIPMIIYNLSRFNDNPNYLKEAVGNLSTIIDGDENKRELIELLNKFLNGEKQQSTSRVMDNLARIIKLESDSSTKEAAVLSGDKFEKIIHSLLSSPCNYTPLLHYVLPVQQNDMRSFAEMWVDPNAEGRNEKGEPVKDCIHLLAVFDIDGIGRFEVEIATAGKELMVNMFCPAAYVAAFSGIEKEIQKPISSTGYRLLGMSVDKLERSRSLMDVFKNLPHKRTGVDVKV